jgi:hypothetical protein
MDKVQKPSDSECLLGFQTVQGPNGNNDGYGVWESLRRVTESQLKPEENKTVFEGVYYFINQIVKFV